jgi:colanic acid biosynthesis glycosyl transferase WcaI
LGRLHAAAAQPDARLGGKKRIQTALLLIVKILYLSQYFPPEMGAPAARAAELSRHWARMGHEVTVLTGFPNHPTGVVPLEWRSRFWQFRNVEVVGGVNVVRTWLWPLPNRKAHERIRNYASFCVSAAISGLDLGRPDVVIGSSPQLLVALSACWLAWWKRVPFVFEVRDLWPESLAAVGAAGEGSALHRALAAIAGFLYGRADRIVVVTSAFKDHLIRFWSVPEKKISIVENGVEADLFRPDQEAGAIRKSLRLEDRFLICYIGTMGMAHGLETLLDVAAQLRESFSQAMFLLIGEGAEKERIFQLALDRKLENVRFIDQQPREKIPAYISAADVCLVMLKKSELFKTVIPTKLIEYMACERPVIVAVDGEARRIAEDAEAGVFVEPENREALVEALLDLRDDLQRRQTMGRNGRKYITTHFSRERTARDYVAVLENVVHGTEKGLNYKGGRDP